LNREGKKKLLKKVRAHAGLMRRGEQEEDTKNNLIQMTIFFKIRKRYLTVKFAN
jgi:hypothetical protein